MHILKEGLCSMDMYELVKKLVLIVVTIAAIIIIGYAALQLYNAAVDDATKRIKTGVTQGVTEGVGSSLNPLKAIGGIFGAGNRTRAGSIK
jgi:ABC-type microcin C transport system permease subunit YejB